MAATPDCQPLLQDSNTDRPLPKSHSRAPLPSSGDEHDSEYKSGSEELRNPSGFWQRLRMATRRRDNTPRFKAVEPLQGTGKKHLSNFESKTWRSARICVLIALLIVIVFATLHFLDIIFGRFPVFMDNAEVPNLDWNMPTRDLLETTRHVTPIPCHSHNDYWRRVPLYDALRAGCTGVEADVWLFDEELYVGHSTNTLTHSQTLRSMYIDPLVKLLDHQNRVAEKVPSTSPPGPKHGLYPQSPAETVVLLIDFKNDGHALFPIVSAHLTALREKNYLTHYNGVATIPGPITVVATGNAPFDLILANTTHRDIFFDAPLATFHPPSSPITTTTTLELAARHDAGQGTVGTTPSSHFDTTNSFYASANFGRAIGWLWFGAVSPAQRQRVRGQIEGARARGLKPRYWGAPTWPAGRRDGVWRVLVREGVAYLNGDDLSAMGRVWRDWGRGRDGKKGGGGGVWVHNV